MYYYIIDIGKVYKELFIFVYMENEKTTTKQETRLGYNDTANENLSLSVHKNGTTFICVHNVISHKEDYDNDTRQITTTDEEGNKVFIALFLKD